jgi:hypothetical protein
MFWPICTSASSIWTMYSVIVAATSYDQHLAHLQQLIQRLQDHGQVINQSIVILQCFVWNSLATRLQLPVPVLYAATWRPLRAFLHPAPSSSCRHFWA